MMESAVMKKGEAGFWQQQRVWCWLNVGCCGELEPGFAWAVCILAGAVSRTYK